MRQSASETGGSKTTNRTIADDLVRLLRKEIVLGQRPPGEHLREVHLAEQFDVSRSTVREVLRRLEGENLVDVVSHRGARIARLEPSDAVEIYELHAMLEEYSIRSVPLPIAPPVCDQLSQIVEQMGELQLPKNVDLFIDLDHEFHDTLMRLADQRQVYRFWHSLKSLHGILVGVSTQHSPSRPEVTAARHARIVEVLCQDDHDTAAAVIGDHYRSMAEQLKGVMVFDERSGATASSAIIDSDRSADQHGSTNS